MLISLHSLDNQFNQSDVLVQGTTKIHVSQTKILQDWLAYATLFNLNPVGMTNIIINAFEEDC